MTDQLLSWLAQVGVVLLAATPVLNRLSAFLKALAGVVTSARAVWRAARPAARLKARPTRKAVTGGKRCSSRRPRANNQL